MVPSIAKEQSPNKPAVYRQTCLRLSQSLAKIINPQNESFVKKKRALAVQ
jgi:hypothetical protein